MIKVLSDSGANDDRAVARFVIRPTYTVARRSVTIDILENLLGSFAIIKNTPTHSGFGPHLLLCYFSGFPLF